LFDIRVLLMDVSKLTFSHPPEGKNAHFRLRQQARRLGCDCRSFERDDIIVARALCTRAASQCSPLQSPRSVSLS
jgi:hypothetical protein